MSKTISTALAQHLAGEVTTLATCWKITRRDGIVLGFTDHVRDLQIDGVVTYKGLSGWACTNVAGRLAVSAVLGAPAQGRRDRQERRSLVGDRLMSGFDRRLDPEVREVRRLEVITGALGRRRWNAEAKARMIVAESLAPGVVVSEVARRHDLRPQ